MALLQHQSHLPLSPPPLLIPGLFPRKSKLINVNYNDPKLCGMLSTQGRYQLSIQVCNSGNNPNISLPFTITGTDASLLRLEYPLDSLLFPALGENGS
jgi:hypothetical protein